jgi:hypothetical protein
MTRQQSGWWIGLTVAALAACSGNPMPGDSGYPYNMTGTYETSIGAMGTVYVGPAEITTSPGGFVYGTLELTGPETVVGVLEGSVAGDTLTFDSHYERGGGCTGVLSGVGTIAEGGESASGDAVVDDDCSGDTFEAVFTMSQKTD